MKTIEGFDEQSYLEANPDVKEAVEKGLFQFGIEHLERHGLEEIQKGIRRFHPEYEPFNEEKYLELFPDIKAAVEKGELKSGFEHFCLFGYKEIIDGLRGWANAEKNKKNLKKRIEKKENSIDIITTSFINIENILVEFKKIFSNVSDTPSKQIKFFSLNDFFNLNTEKFLNERKYLRPVIEKYMSHVAIENIRKGETKFHKNYKPFDSIEYLRINQDLIHPIEDGLFTDSFDHFCQYGYSEIINGKRYWPKDEKNQNVEFLRLLNLNRIVLRRLNGK